mgnify:CR=1 FL=1
MPRDKYSATWVSHSSISDFLACPQAYYYKNVFKHAKTGNKIQIMTPPLALGQAVHEVIEALSVIPVDRRFETPLLETFKTAWKKVSGKKGGFFSDETESQYKRRGEAMLRRVTRNPGPLLNLAVKIDEKIPNYWLSEEDNIILCGKIDWLEYNKENDSVHIIDFKTGKGKEQEDSLQLPIYHLLAHNCQSHPVEKASYWYIEQNDKPTEKKLPDLEKSHEKVLKIAKKMKLARQLESFKCPRGEQCSYCREYKAVAEGKGEMVGTGEMGNDIYVLSENLDDSKEKSVIL